MKGHTFARKHRLGFTIIEVSLYLAITAMLFAGIAVTTQSRIENQRYNEAVSDYVEFLRNVYSEVENTQNINYGSTTNSYRKGCTVEGGQDLIITPTGQSNCAFYGKVIIFDTDGDLNKITVADLIGETIEHTDSLEKKFDNLNNTVKALGENNANSIFGSLLAVRAGFRANICNNAHADCQENFAADHYEYTLPYDYRIETRVDNDTTTRSDLFQNKIIIIARAPSDNQIHTITYEENSNLLTKKLSEYTSVPTRYSQDFCIDQNLDPNSNSPNRRNVRILPELTESGASVDSGTGVSSASSVVLIAQDASRNSTSENNGYHGNRCRW